MTRSTASSIVPTIENACSGKSSNSPLVALGEQNRDLNAADAARDDDLVVDVGMSAAGADDLLVSGGAVGDPPVGHDAGVVVDDPVQIELAGRLATAQALADLRDPSAGGDELGGGLQG